jgi:hypothetical protein
VLGPLLVALAMQLLALIGRGAWLHLVLVGSAFGDWHGLFAQPAFVSALVVGSLVSIGWIAACLRGSWSALAARDFAGVSVVRRAGWRAPVRVALAGAALLVLLTVATNWGPAA